MKRKFIYFTDDELNILKDALDEKNAPDLQEQLKKEMYEREFNRKVQEEWMGAIPYAC